MNTRRGDGDREGSECLVQGKRARLAASDIENPRASCTDNVALKIALIAQDALPCVPQILRT